MYCTLEILKNGDIIYNNKILENIKEIVLKYLFEIKIHKKLCDDEINNFKNIFSNYKDCVYVYCDQESNFIDLFKLARIFTFYFVSNNINMNNFRIKVKLISNSDEIIKISNKNIYELHIQDSKFIKLKNCTIKYLSVLDNIMTSAKFSNVDDGLQKNYMCASINNCNIEKIDVCSLSKLKISKLTNKNCVIKKVGLTKIYDSKLSNIEFNCSINTIIKNSDISFILKNTTASYRSGKFYHMLYLINSNIKIVDVNYINNIYCYNIKSEEFSSSNSSIVQFKKINHIENLKIWYNKKYLTGLNHIKSVKKLELYAIDYVKFNFYNLIYSLIILDIKKCKISDAVNYFFSINNKRTMMMNIYKDVIQKGKKNIDTEERTKKIDELYDSTVHVENLLNGARKLLGL